MQPAALLALSPYVAPATDALLWKAIALAGVAIVALMILKEFLRRLGLFHPPERKSRSSRNRNKP